MNSQPWYWFELVLVGDVGVGKSCLVARFVNDVFNRRYIFFGDCRFESWAIDVDVKTVRFNIRDVAGKKKTCPLDRTYFENADAMIVVYDCTSLKSFDNVKQWIEEVDRHGPENVSKFLVATKCDLTEEKVVDHDTAKTYADQLGIQLFETSSKTATNVEEAFAAMAKQLIQKVNSPLSIAPPTKRMRIRDRSIERLDFRCYFRSPSNGNSTLSNTGEDDITSFSDLWKRMKQTFDEGFARIENKVADAVNRIEKLENKVAEAVNRTEKLENKEKMTDQRLLKYLQKRLYANRAARMLK